MEGFESKYYETIQRMQSITIFYKYGRRGDPHFRNFQLSEDLSKIIWYSPHKDTTSTKVSIKDMIKVEIGINCKITDRVDPSMRHLAFSVLYRSDNDVQELSLDIVSKDKADFDLWTSGIIFLIENKNKLEDILSQYNQRTTTLNSNNNRIGSDSQDYTIVDVRGLRAAMQQINDLYMWGFGGWGQLGFVDDVDELQDIQTPRIVRALVDKDVSVGFVACGVNHTIAISQEGNVFSWGNSGCGRLGHPIESDTTDHILLPRLIPELRNVKAVACGDFHTLFLTLDGILYSCGSNVMGQLGHGDVLDRDIVQMVDFGGIRINLIAAGGLFSAAVQDTSGYLYTWGCGESGVLGHGDDLNALKPRLVTAFNGWSVTQISCGGSHMACIADNNELGNAGQFGFKNTVFTWGWGGCGQLGHDSFESCFSPTAIQFFKGKVTKQIACGAAHTAAIIELQYRPLKAFGDDFNINAQLFLWGCGLAMPHFRKSNRSKVSQGAGISSKKSISGPSLNGSTISKQQNDENGINGDNSQMRDFVSSEYNTPEHIKYPRLFSLDPTLQENNSNINMIPSFVNIACGNNFTIAIDDDGKNLTVIGSSPIPGIPTGEPIAELDDYEIKLVAAGGRHIGVLVARQWIKDKDVTECTKCKNVFTAFRRRHHCRNCGGIFCGRCTQNRVAIMRLGYSVPQRVCEKCFEQLKYR